MKRTLNIILTHQPPGCVAKMLEWWTKSVAAEDILLACGGTQADFEAIAHPQKFFVDDPRLRTRDHQREFQSYSAIYRKASEWLAARPHECVHFCEYDEIPLAPDFNQKQVERLETERADVLGYRLVRIDGTNHPHYLNHASNPRFLEFWKSITVRSEPGVVISMFATGSVWRRNAFDAVAAVEEPFPLYVELYQPTLAHHLGFRVRPLRDQDRFVDNLADMTPTMDEARRAGAWVIHPVKALWSA